ncbi:hypothetical protein BGZ75_007961 [Mortierella antarctica]|nr:hypothetical protein BGZ75_007961 [Mortierella antarctica]
MSIFKLSNKNKTASAASSVVSTPAQTPRSSMQEQRPAQATKMTRDQALEKIMKKTYGAAAAKDQTSSATTKNTQNVTNMSPFQRSNKIQSSSAASIPTQVPSSAKKVQLPTQATKMTPEEAALETLMQKSMGNATTGHYIH